MTSTSRRSFVTALGLAALAGSRRTFGQAPLTRMSITLEFTAGGFHSPLYLAQQKGWFRDAGLDVTIRDGKGSGSTLSLVGAGQSDLGFAPGSAMAIARAKGVPIKTVAVLLNKNGYGLILKKGSPLRKPADFKGKEILYNTSSLEGPFVESFLASGKVSKSDVRLLGVDASAKASSVIAGKSDAAVAPVPYYVGLLAGKQEIDTLLFADFGDRMVDIGIVASEDVIRSKPAALRSFVAVVSRAYQYVADNHVDESAAALVALRPDANVDATSAANMYRAYARNTFTPATEGKPIGSISEAAWAETIETLRRQQLIAGDVRAQDMYDLSFAPR